MKIILLQASAIILGVCFLGGILILEKPALLLTQCTAVDPCYKKLSIDSGSLYKTAFNSSMIFESSGLVTSRKHPGTLWTHNDSGSRSVIYAIDRFGNLQGFTYIADVWAIDWEDIANDNQGKLYVLDYSIKRTEQFVYVIPEPEPSGFSLSFTEKKIRFNLPDLPGNEDGRTDFKSEALFWANNKLYLLTKDAGHRQTILYRFPDTRSETAITLEKIATLDLSHETFEFGGRVTAADISPDGRFLVILTYWALYFFQQPIDSDNYFSKPAGSILTKGRLGQAEGISWHNNDILVGSEDGNLYLIDNVFSRLDRLKSK